MALTRTALTAAIGPNDLILTVTSTTGATAKGLCIVNNEYMWVSEIISSTQVRVRHRGANGGVARSHVATSQVIFCLPSDRPARVRATDDPDGGPTVIAYSASGAIDLPTRDTRVLLVGGSAQAMTLANPDANVPDGTKLEIVGQGAAAHTVTYTPGFQQNTTSGDVATFAAGGGGVLTVIAYAGKWGSVSTSGVTIA